jgi:glycerol-3-phosphate dehydrogenase
MKRDIKTLLDATYDLLIIGGGITGACAAWDAALRGLTVALLEKGDFGGATSANSLKIIHGGLRYLQQADLLRMRRAIQERAIFMRIAPHFVYPIPFLVPTYRHFKEKKGILRFVMRINDLMGIDLNRSNGTNLSIPPGRVVSKEECLKIFSGFDRVNGWFSHSSSQPRSKVQ